MLFKASEALQGHRRWLRNLMICALGGYYRSVRAWLSPIVAARCGINDLGVGVLQPI
jgi:hypothetical protein